MARSKNLKCLIDFDKTGQLNTCSSLDGIVCPQNLGLEPRQVVDSNPVLLSGNCDENVLTFEHFHLLEATSRDQLEKIQIVLIRTHSI